MLQRINYDEEQQAFYVDDDGMFCDAYAALAEIAALKARIAELESRLAPADDWVDWEKVPSGYDWVAADGNGDPFAYTRVPEKGPTFWSSASEYTSCPTLGTLPLGIDWRQSLRRRPGGEEE